MALDKTFASGDILSASDANAYMRSMWTPIDKRVIPLASPVASISFASLDSNFRLFRLTYHLIAITLSSIAIRINNDSGNSYYYQYVVGGGTSVSAARPGPGDSIDTMGGNTLFEGIIGKPLTTTPGRMTASFTEGTSVSTFQTGNLAAWWNNTSALINRIDLVTLAPGTMYGVASLEGLRGI